MISAADVIIKLAKAVAGDGEINGLCRRYSGRAVNVMVGGYGKEDDGLTEDNAPFIWIYPQSDDMPMGATDQIAEMKVGVVVGLRAEKDAPGMSDALASLNGMTASANGLWSIIRDNEAAVGTPEYTAALADATEAEAAVEEDARDFTTAVNGSNFDAASAAFTALNAHYVALRTAATDARNAAEDAEKDEVVAAIETGMDNAATATEAFGAAWAAVVAAYEAYQDDPYFREVVSERTDSSGGLVIFGALRLFDAFRRRLHSIALDGDFGLPVTDVTFRNNSISHYPLDWLEFTLTLGEPANL